ncbi:MAG: pyridoxamine 5'-phosphate oxidase family protein [Verrucomicrobiota bacterium]
MENPTEKIRELLKKFDTAMLVTQGHGRPMGIAEVSENGDVWFFTARDTAKVHEIQQNEKVLIICQNDHARYLSLAGHADLISDRNKAKELWKESYKTWFPGGAEDRDLLLIRVRPHEVEFWDNSGFKGAKYLFEAAKAYVTGTRPDVHDPNQHGKVNL